MRLLFRAIPTSLMLALAVSACAPVVELEDASVDDDAISSALGGVESIECPSQKPWTGAITTNESGFSPRLVRVAVGHILMFAPPAGSDDEIVADDGSFRTERETDGVECLKFTRAGSYPYHSELHPDELRGLIEIH